MNVLTFEINEQERELLLDVLKSAHTSLLDELHHTESYDYKQMLKLKEAALENLRAKIAGSDSDNTLV